MMDSGQVVASERERERERLNIPNTPKISCFGRAQGNLMAAVHVQLRLGPGTLS